MRIRRREFLGLAGAAVLGVPSVVRAQQLTKSPRVVVLSNINPDDRVPVFIQALADLGYVDGKTVSLSVIISPTIADAPNAVHQALALRPDLIVTFGSPLPLALKSIGAKQPVIVTGIQDPVAVGLAQSYSRPGGNVTGVMQATPDLIAKELQLLREIVPLLMRVAFFAQPDDPPYAVTKEQVAAAAAELGVAVVEIDFVDGDPFAPGFDRAQTSKATAVLVSSASFFSNNAASVASLALQRRLPIVAGVVSARAGGLIGYGADNLELSRRAATYVDAVLKGANPAELPIEAPKTFDLVVNLKTAAGLGLTVPQSVLLRATEVIS